MQKMKLGVSAAVLLSAFTLPAAAMSGLENGDFVIGVGLLSSTLDSNYSSNTSTANGKEKYSANNTDLNGEVFVGYTWDVNQNFDLGLEFYYDFGGNETKQSTTLLGHTTHEVNYVLGLRALPMMNITEKTSLFLDLGWAYIDQEINVKNVTATSPTFTKKSHSNNVSAYRYGAGVQMEVVDNVLVRASYVVIDGGSDVKRKADDTQFYVKAEPTIHNFMVNVAYAFNFM